MSTRFLHFYIKNRLLGEFFYIYQPFLHKISLKSRLGGTHKSFSDCEKKRKHIACIFESRGRHVIYDIRKAFKKHRIVKLKKRVCGMQYFSFKAKLCAEKTKGVFFCVPRNRLIQKPLPCQKSETHEQQRRDDKGTHKIRNIFSFHTFIFLYSSPVTWHRLLISQDSLRKLLQNGEPHRAYLHSFPPQAEDIPKTTAD